MSIVKTITDSRIPALVSKVRGTFEEYQRLRERYDAFNGLPSFNSASKADVASVETYLREFCAAIPAKQKKAEGSAEVSARLYAGLVEALPIGEQAVALITKKIARLEQERADAEAEAEAAKWRRLEEAEAAERRRLAEAEETEANERRRQEEERKRQEEEAKKRRKEAAQERCKEWFIFKKTLVIIIAVAYFLIGLTNSADEFQKMLFLGYLASTWIICVFPYPDVRIMVFEGIGLAIIFGLGKLVEAIGYGGGGTFHMFLPTGLVILSFKLLSARQERWE
jgi:hypothetical protein